MNYNYIKHLNTWMVVFRQQEKARPVHASTYLALFEMWNINRFNASFVMPRSNLMQAAKLRSNKTYSEVLKEMVEWGWLEYTAGNTFFGLSTFSLTHYSALKKMIKDDGDQVSPYGTDSDISDTPSGTSMSVPTGTQSTTSTTTPIDTPINKDNKGLNNKLNKGNNSYEEPL